MLYIIHPGSRSIMVTEQATITNRNTDLTIPYSLSPKPSGQYFCICLIEAKDRLNLGSILRLAVNFKANAVFLVRCRYRRVQTDTLHATHQLPIIELNEIPRILECTYVHVDFCENAENLIKFQHPKRAMYIFGGEDRTLIPNDSIESEHIVYIPTVGSCNLAVSVGILLYDRLTKLSKHHKFMN